MSLCAAEEDLSKGRTRRPRDQRQLSVVNCWLLLRGFHAEIIFGSCRRLIVAGSAGFADGFVIIAIVKLGPEDKVGASGGDQIFVALLAFR